MINRVLAGALIVALVGVQLVAPGGAEASHLGSSTASAGSAPPPAVSAVQSFQPDLFTGRATTAVPIAVPPGRRGVQPMLALSYSSSGRNGWLGVGWSLDVGYLERDTKRGVPTYTASDTFVLVFQGVTADLVKIPDGTYRAKDEGAFLRVENRGTSGWEVRDKSGTRYLFGQVSSSRLESGSQTFRWCLDKVVDVNGNSMTFAYVRDQNQLYLSQIRYTGHEPTALAPANQVDFVLEDRPDAEPSHRAGFLVVTAKRLKTVETKATVAAALVLARRYALGYRVSPRTGRSLLASVTQVGTDGVTSLPPTTFAYQDTGSPTYTVFTNNPTTSIPGWNLLTAHADIGHDNYGTECPPIDGAPDCTRKGIPWGPRQQVTGPATTQLGGLRVTVGGDGALAVSGGGDDYVYAWTLVYVSSEKTIALALSWPEAEFGLWCEDATGIRRILGSTVALRAGWSALHLTAYNQHAGWSFSLTSPLITLVDLMTPSQFVAPRMAADVDGNAVTDLIAFNPATGAWSVSCASAAAVCPAGPWLTGFGTSASTPVVGDWDANGRTDVAIFNGGTWRFATSTGTSFRADALPQLSFGSGTPMTGDVNGDGTTDLATYDNGTWSVALGSGSGFTPAPSSSVSWGSSSVDPLTGDWNGDGLTDIGLVNKSTGAIDVRLSTGTGWAAPSAWISGFGPGQSHTSADVNGDGLSDAVYYERATGQVRYAPSTGAGFGPATTLPTTFTQRSADDHLQAADFNGDGIADPAVFNVVTGASELAFSAGTTPDLLTTIRNGFGGATAITYYLSTQVDNTSPVDGLPRLPFVVPLVQKATASDGLGNSYTTTYLYAQGFYDAATKEFRGFARAEVRDPDANVAITEFHQDATRKGRPFRTAAQDSNSNLWAKTEQTWSSAELFPGVVFTRLDQTDSYLYDGDATFKQTRAAYEYDPFGNVTKVREFGDVAVAGDERQTFNTYTTNPTAWILGALAHTKLTDAIDATGRTVRERWFYYDGRLPSNPGSPTIDTTPPTKGLLTAELEWWDTTDPVDPNPLTRIAYDSFGNVATATDALGRATSNTYDAIGTYLIRITNVLDHSRQMVYDPRTGQVTSSTDPNGVTASTVYDAVGRVTKVIGPNDTATLPTVSYEYDLSSVPIRTTARARIQSGQTAEVVTHAFTDGLGRTIQTRSPAEDPAKQIVTGTVQFNARGLAVKQWVPYSSNLSSAYVPAAQEPSFALLAAAAYTYDPVGRVLTVTDPDGAKTTTAYNDGTVIVTDARGNVTRRMTDAYGRLAKVEEVNGAEVYTTAYAYDALNHLTTVTDAKGNLTRITYDTLGRKVSMNDPDMGRWTYAYDAVDNLLSQTDARGTTITFTYDALNRLTRKVAPGAVVTYAYDNPAKAFSKGKLTEIADGSGGSGFEYDNLGRLVRETKTVDGVPYTIQRTYDLLGRLTQLTYPDNERALYTYNAQGGMKTIMLQGASAQTIVSDVRYNAAGQILKIAYGNGTVSDYTYNPQTLRLDQLKTTGPAGPVQDFSYTFDPVGNVAAITDRVHTATQTFEYDALNRLTRAVGSYGDSRYVYNAIGNMTSKEGVAMTYGVPDGSKPHAVTATAAGWTMQYDANGNMVTKATDPRATVAPLTAQYLTYDAENRVTEVATASEETVTLTFQPGWNTFALPVIPTDASMAALFPTFAADFEQIARYDAATGTFQHYVGNAKFDDFTTLDEYGRGYQAYCKAAGPVTITIKGKLPTTPLSKPLAVGWHLLAGITLTPTTPSAIFGSVNAEQILTYDPATGTFVAASTVERGKAYFVKVKTASIWTPPLPRSVTTRFVYDGDGGRVKQTTPQGTTKFLGQNVEIAPDGTVTKYVFAGGQRVAAKDSTGPMRFYHGDHLGSSNVITDGTGKVVELAEYTPYGTLSHREGTANVPQKFTGQRLDTSTGLYFYNARYYDPQLGRFIQADTIVPSPGDPQTLNRYSYVRNNPVKYVDPSGHSIFGKIWKWFGEHVISKLFGNSTWEFVDKYK